MFAHANDDYPQNSHLIHVYVPDVDAVFKQVRAAGCEIVQEPTKRQGDPDRRGTFKDFAGNMWTVATQVEKK